jgi:predicted lactoylglutathione lyase
VPGTKYPGWACWQRPGEAEKLWVGKPQNGQPASHGNGWMVALTAPSRAAVDAAYAAAIAAGGTDEGQPGLRPTYAADYYGAYVRDLEGNKLHFVTRGD